LNRSFTLSEGFERVIETKFANPLFTTVERMVESLRNILKPDYLGIKIPPDLHQKIKKLAQKQRVNKSKAATELLRLGLAAPTAQGILDTVRKIEKKIGKTDRKEMKTEYEAVSVLEMVVTEIRNGNSQKALSIADGFLEGAVNGQN
jgi:hypothetical protein